MPLEWFIYRVRRVVKLDIVVRGFSAFQALLERRDGNWRDKKRNEMFISKFLSFVPPRHSLSIVIDEVELQC